MRRRTGILAAVLMVAVGLAGCRHPDGQVPAPVDGDEINEVGDIVGDLRNVAAGQRDAVEELRHDLLNLSIDEKSPELVHELSAALGSAVASRELTEPAAERIAAVLFVVMTARHLSPRQIEQVRSDMHDALVSAGIDGQAADHVAGAAGDFQASVTDNQRRWYYLY